MSLPILYRRVECAMKFCYLDESGTGGEPYAVMVGIIVDASRMHVTKSDWSELLALLSDVAGKPIAEFHTRDFYSGNNAWRALRGDARAQVITVILNWLADRKHKVSFCGIVNEAYQNARQTDLFLHDLRSIWCMLALHQLLILQKVHQSEARNKGNTVFIFDHEVKEQTRLAKLVAAPPAWTDSYYSRSRRQAQFDQVIDVPYYGDSCEVNLIQIADLIAYLLRRYVEINDGASSPRYPDESARLQHWIGTILRCSLPVSTRYPAKSRDAAADFFYRYAPPSLRTLGR